MIRFDYTRASDIAGAIAAAQKTGADYLAAGTNLLDLMKGGVSRPDRLVDVTRLPGLDRIEPQLNVGSPGDERDTTTPDAMLATMQALLFGPALAEASRGRLLTWLRACTTGLDQLRFVTHLDVDAAGVDRAVEAAREFLSQP